MDEVRRAEFFRKGGAERDIVRGKRWLLLTSWVNLDRSEQRQLNQLFALNRRVMKAYLLKESLARLWDFTYEAAMLRYLKSWNDQLRWQRLAPMQKLRICCSNTWKGFSTTAKPRSHGRGRGGEGNIKALLRRGRGYRDLDYCY